MTRTGEPVLPVGPTDLHLAAHLFQPARLTLARELRGLTKAELAERIDRSAAAIGQFEGGGRATCRPDAKTVGALALALGVPVAFFTRKTPANLLEVDDCHFRSLRSASQRARRRLLARGSLLCDLMGFLDEQVEFPREQVSSVARTVRSEADIEACAVRVRRAWGLGLGPINNVVNLLERSGVLVTHVPENCADVDAFSTWHEGRPLIFLVMHKGSTSRTRFDACHELGHLVMHADVAAANPDLERQANRFASAFLLPKESFLIECPRGLNWDHFYELKRRWKVSVGALIRRAFDLKCISEATYRRAYVHMNKTGERTQERDEPPVELPTLISKAMVAVHPDITPQNLAARIGLAVADLQDLHALADMGIPSGNK
jgi:Zn-dependent peptidase ImmA (M78 family)/transcriptional regulator with XRE-family HTH domain